MPGLQSVDPWHAASDPDYRRGDQIGFDFFFHCGVTRGLPAMIPIAILYAIAEGAANEIALPPSPKHLSSFCAVSSAMK